MRSCGATNTKVDAGSKSAYSGAPAAHNTRLTSGRRGRVCEGFRMTAHRDGWAGTGAVVRKPPGKEPAGCGAQRCRTLYGDFTATLEDTGADEMSGGASAEPRGGGNEGRVARQQESEADLGFTGWRL